MSGTQTDTDKKNDVKSMSFETALSELEKIVQNLERGEISLEESITAYERGELLKSHCTHLLKAAEDKVEKIKLSREGTVTSTEPFE